MHPPVDRFRLITAAVEAAERYRPRPAAMTVRLLFVGGGTPSLRGRKPENKTPCPPRGPAAPPPRRRMMPSLQVLRTGRRGLRQRRRLAASPCLFACQAATPPGDSSLRVTHARRRKPLGFESRVDPNNKEAMSLIEARRMGMALTRFIPRGCATRSLSRQAGGAPRIRGAQPDAAVYAHSSCCVGAQEMRMHTEKLKAHRKNEDPRLSFTTPEFKEASRVFTEAYKVRSVVFAYAPKGLLKMAKKLKSVKSWLVFQSNPKRLATLLVVCHALQNCSKHVHQKMQQSWRK